MPDTINTGTMLIEEGTFLPAVSSQFESEPWTSFYMAGETIRDLRKTRQIETSTGAKTPERPEHDRRDEEAFSRKDQEGCSNDPTGTQPDATGYSGIGGRLLPVGSPTS